MGNETVSYWPFAILALSVGLIVLLIVKLRVHAFFALLIAAVFVGLLSNSLPIIQGKEGLGHVLQAFEWPMIEFGVTAGKIAYVIAVASVIGVCLMESGAADRIVQTLLNALGEQRAALALLASGFFLSIPVFFDTVFFLLIPLARALALRTGKNYLLYVMAICGGGVLTHSLVAPTPGPLIMAENLKLDLGWSIIAGIVAGILPCWVTLRLGRRIDETVKQKRPLDAADDDSPASQESAPSFALSALPVVLPVALISLASFFGLAARSMPWFVDLFGGDEGFAKARAFVDVIGNKNLAMTLGAVIALWVLARQKKMTLDRLGEVMGRPLSTAGVIILITSAGGAFGAMIKHSGVGKSVEALAEAMNLNYILLAWLLSSIMKIAQGSGTVAMITTSLMMAEIVGDGGSLAYHPMYIFLAIGFGSFTLSWMNDSAFWVVGRLSGFTEKETLQTWTKLLGAMSLAGLVQLLIVSNVLPFAVN